VVKWIVLAAVLVGLLALGLAIRRVASRLPRLRRAALALQRRQEQAEDLQQVALSVQDRAEALQQQVDVLHQRLTLIKAKRGKEA
jgi:cytochrome c oxidase assembly factor CtaG